MSEKQKTSGMVLRVFCIAIVLCFAVGLIMMLCGSFAAGLIPWFAAMVIGAITLYAKRKQDQKRADEAEMEAQERAYQEKKRAQRREKK